MAKDAVYTNGVIAVKELSLIGTKVLKLCELSADEAFRSLAESGFGKGADAGSIYEYEALLSADAQDIDAFIREYAPGQAEREYLLSARDFHNAKALVKAQATGADVKKMLSPEGLVPVSRMEACLQEGDFASLGDLSAAMREALKLSEDNASGAQIGAVFEKALFAHLSSACKRSGYLKGLLAAKADMTNLLTAFRSETFVEARGAFVGGGKLKESTLEKLFEDDGATRALAGTDYRKFYEICAEAKAAGQPFTEAEKLLADLEIDSLSKNKFELKRGEPFLYYVFRRRIDNANVRILLACLLAGRSEQEIKRRLRAI